MRSCGRKLTPACDARLAQSNSGIRDVRMAMSVMEIHADSISDLLSAEPHRRLEVKKVQNLSSRILCLPDSKHNGMCQWTEGIHLSNSRQTRCMIPSCGVS